MITKPELIKILIKEYDKLLNLYSRNLDAYDDEDRALINQEGRVNAFKECILGQQKKEEDKDE
jgi:hypothetical protein|tara:strand:- start:4545 stop:4733 length:189 start_codon:yes stop_codon:yes gene_type:complete